jgi:hypothetical protein
VGTTDSVIKPALTNLVMQNSSTYDRATRLDTDFTAQRNLGTLASESAIGSTVNPGMVPKEIHSRQKAE